MTSLRSRERTPRLPTRAWVVAGLAAVLTLGPVFRSPPRDSFPLSTFPMFSSAVPTVVDLPLAVGVDDRGERITLSPELIADTDEVIVAGGTVRASIRTGTDGDLCADIARRVAAGGPDRAVEVLIVTDTVDAIAWYAGEREPDAVTEHSRCPVVRP